jgi:hypothetical protein
MALATTLQKFAQPLELAFAQIQHALLVAVVLPPTLIYAQLFKDLTNVQSETMLLVQLL